MSKRVNNPNRRNREKLMAIDPHCHWCGIEVKDYNIKQMQRHGPPNDMATLDHIYTKLEWEKRMEAAKAGDQNRHVLACNRCNQKRNKKDFEKIGGTDSWKIRTKLGLERKITGDKRSRPQLFRGLENLDA